MDLCDIIDNLYNRNTFYVDKIQNPHFIFKIAKFGHARNVKKCEKCSLAKFTDFVN